MIKNDIHLTVISFQCQPSKLTAKKIVFGDKEHIID